MIHPEPRSVDEFRYRDTEYKEYKPNINGIGR